MILPLKHIQPKSMKMSAWLTTPEVKGGFNFRSVEM